jgi:hypothetical protein
LRTIPACGELAIAERSARVTAAAEVAACDGDGEGEAIVAGLGSEHPKRLDPRASPMKSRRFVLIFPRRSGATIVQLRRRD